MITEEEFITLYVEHETDLRGLARSLMPQPADAADVLQEACIAMWRKIGTLEDRRAFRNWACSYVRFTALNQRRKKQKSPLRFSSELIEIMADEWERDEDRVRAERLALAACIRELPEKQRQLLTQYYATSRTTAVDLGKRLGKPLAGIYKALERTRALLRECVTEKLRTQGLA